MPTVRPRAEPAVSRSLGETAEPAKDRMNPPPKRWRSSMRKQWLSLGGALPTAMESRWDALPRTSSRFWPICRSCFSSCGSKPATGRCGGKTTLRLPWETNPSPRRPDSGHIQKPNQNREGTCRTGSGRSPAPTWGAAETGVQLLLAGIYRASDHAPPMAQFHGPPSISTRPGFAFDTPISFWRSFAGWNPI